MSGSSFASGLAAGLRRRLAGHRPPLAEQPLTAQAYLAQHYDTVPGFSSRFSAEIAVRLLEFQQQNNLTGHVGEIGVLMGRSFIALALASAPQDICLAIDDFTWPEHVQERFLASCRAMQVDLSRVTTIAANTTTLNATEILTRLDGRGLRYLHVDGGHTPAVLRHDLKMARQLMEPCGIICLDDMLHAQYPELGIAVRDELAADPDFAVFCVIDRADLIAAAKFLICRRGYAERYQAALRTAFAAAVFPEPAEFAAGPALILSKETALVPHYRNAIERPAT